MCHAWEAWSVFLVIQHGTGHGGREEGTSACVRRRHHKNISSTAASCSRSDISSLTQIVSHCAIRAAVMRATFVAEYELIFTISAQATKLYSKMFPDSEGAEKSLVDAQRLQQL